jgi:hypothetical protein
MAIFNREQVRMRLYSLIVRKCYPIFLKIVNFIFILTETAESHSSDGREYQRSTDVLPLGGQEHGATSTAIMVGVPAIKSYPSITGHLLLFSVCVWIQGKKDWCKVSWWLTLYNELLWFNLRVAGLPSGISVACYEWFLESSSGCAWLMWLCFPVHDRSHRFSPGIWVSSCFGCPW